MSATRSPAFTTFSPGLWVEDESANYWLQQVTIRLRREICWRWQQRGQNGSAPSSLPPIEDFLTTSLDLSRYWVQKCQFFQTDPTAQYLSAQLAPPSLPSDSSVRGSMSWVISTLNLDPVSAFVLALGLSAAFDPAIAPVIATCLNDATATQPTLVLAQQLWDAPEQVLAIADPAHPLWAYGLLQPASSGSQAAINWQTALVVPPAVATTLLFPRSTSAFGVVPIPGEPSAVTDLPERARQVAQRLQAQEATHLLIVPLQSGQGAATGSVVQGMAQIIQRPVMTLHSGLTHRTALKPWLTLGWLQGWDLFLPTDSLGGKIQETLIDGVLSLQAVPLTLFLDLGDGRKETCSHRSLIQQLPHQILLPVVEVPRSSYGDRQLCWQQYLGTEPTLSEGIAECSRRFRYEPETIHQICTGLQNSPQPLTTLNLIAACRTEVDLDMGELAQPVTPRFQDSDLVLPPKQRSLFAEVYKAMTSLTTVHYDWGTAQAWNECGIAVLFAGPPGTGKTMAAEVLAQRLNLPMYRIDLSQVVNKYIGETEKNLKRLFDLADISDTLLFFDEADALFGRRTEVKDAHDRYANLEISYLLERMERFKGLAILATNRKKDLDEAFLRRLRYIIDFPLPDIPERRRIWQQVMPPQVDSSQLDFDFLARQFPLAGGHIRSIVFNACLQAANGAAPQLTMTSVLIAVKREYDKLNRSVSLEQFGSYAKFIQDIAHE